MAGVPVAIVAAGRVALWSYRGYKALQLIDRAIDYYDDYKNPIDWRFQYNTPALNDGVIYYH